MATRKAGSTTKRKVTTGGCNQDDNPLVLLNATRTPEERALAASKAGIASGAARRAKGDLVRVLRDAVEENPEKIADVLMRIIQDDSRPTNQLKAFELLSKVLGLLSDNAQVTISNNVSFNTLDMSTLSDDELRRYADQQIVDADDT